MNECMNIYELIQKELDGELSAKESAILEKHCIHCFACRQLREDFFQDVLTLNRLPLPEPGEDFILNVMTAITNKPQLKPKQMFSSFTGFVAGIILVLWSGIFMLATAVIAMLVGGLFYFNITDLSIISGSLLSRWGTLIYYIAKIVDTLGAIFPPGLLMILLLISMGSFLVLIMLIYSRRTIGYEN